MSEVEKYKVNSDVREGAPSAPRSRQKPTVSAPGLPAGGGRARQVKDPLEELNERLAIVRDRVRGVARSYHNGLYLFGRPGTSKTYTVAQTLTGDGVPFHHQFGHLTPIGLFELLDAQHDRVIVLDDVSCLFADKKALQILLAALGTQQNGQRARVIRYQRHKRVAEITFTGGIICISNLELNQSPLLAALRSRVNYIKHDPTDEQIEALMFSVAAKGWPAEQPELTPAECREVTEFVIAESRQRETHLDMRVLVDKAFPDYLQWRSHDTEAHWRDLVKATFEERLAALQYTTPESLTRRGQKLADQQTVRRILQACRTTADRVAAWRSLTGKSERAYFRRAREIA
ncbi:MAG: hypothetical protein NTV86_00825 [Planctomycetota bacterium]|nr:hypothetical protein [Planctomycetota bacterium]